MSAASRWALLLIAGAITLPLAAQNAVRVERFSVMGSGQAIEVEIQTTGAVKPQSQMVTGPDRIIVDFPGALPSSTLRALSVSRGALKGVRAGLFSSNPPVTRVVLDLAAPQSYQIFSVRNVVMLKVGPLAGGHAPEPVIASAGEVSSPPDGQPAEPPKPAMEVSFHNGMLRIHAERATLAQVLFEVQRQTGAEIAIPAGAESEEIAANLGPAPAREVLAALLNGSRYNFIFVGNTRGRTLQKAILSVR